MGKYDLRQPKRAGKPVQKYEKNYVWKNHDKKTFSEIAKVLERSEKAVRQILYRIRKEKGLINSYLTNVFGRVEPAYLTTYIYPIGSSIFIKGVEYEVLIDYGQSIMAVSRKDYCKKIMIDKNNIK